MSLRVRELFLRTLGCLGTSVVGLVGVVVALLVIAAVERAVRPQFDTPVPGVALGALVVAGGMAALLWLSRRR